MRKVHIIPALPTGPDMGDGGIRQVIRGQIAHLSKFGWEYTPEASEADLIACHIEVPPNYPRLYPGKPIVLHNHGLYWTPDYDWDQQWCFDVNQRVMQGVRLADGVTAVSEWTAQALRRHSLRDVRVVYHGVDTKEWTPPEDRGAYVLWNKTRTDPICNPAPVNDLATMLRDVPFISTFGDDRIPNLSLTGSLPYEDAKEYVRRAGVYLCTTRETFGIGTLEALACGVPVVGWRWGGQLEIIEHGVDGWLVRPGDVEGLAEGVRWAQENRNEIAVRAREKAAQFSVADSAEQYAAFYDEVYERVTRERPKVSVIVPVYNMGDYLEDTLRSVAAQTMEQFECIIVDDASPDDRDREIANRYADEDSRFKIVTHPKNRYLAEARNTGIEASTGQYVLPLDADDMITPRTLAVLSDALDGDRTMHIAYGNVLFVEEDGKTPRVYQEGQSRGLLPGHSGWPVSFRLDWQLDARGQLLPYSSMYRREVWELVGGYRRRARSSEDCEFWLRTTSYGFAPRMVTNVDTLVYRLRDDSMSSAGGEGWEEHRPWFPWVNDRSALPAAAEREGPAERMPVPALDPPQIAVVIPVGPGHEHLVQDAVDSVDAQTYRLWECIVVNDSGAPLTRLPSWVRLVEPEVGERFGGVAAARNAGIAVTGARLFLPLDADDYLQPRALELMLEAHLERDDQPMVYCDFWENKNPDDRTQFTVWQVPDYDPNLYKEKGLFHAVTVLTPTAVWREIGGYDEDLPAWEDWAFALSAAALGHCARRVASPLFTYRKDTGFRREDNYADYERSREAMLAMNFRDLVGVEGDLLACSKCPGGRPTTYGAAMTIMKQRSGPGGSPDGGAKLIEYTGNKAGSIGFRGAPGQDGRSPVYNFSSGHRKNWVAAPDVERLLSRPDFRIASEEPTLPQTAEPVMMAARTPDALARAANSAPAQAPASPPAPAPPPAQEPPLAEDRLKVLMAMSRSDLNAEAAEAGITNAEDRNVFANKGKVADAIMAAERIKAEMATA